MLQRDVLLARRLHESEKIQRLDQKVPKGKVFKGGQNQDHPKVIETQ